MKNSELTAQRIEIQEFKDRYVATECLKELLKKGKDLKINPTDITDYVDLRCSVINLEDRYIPFNVEIKERIKSEQQLAKFPNAELKVAKYDRMRKATRKGTRLLYMVLLNKETCLVFDLDKLDWTKVEKKNWRIKQTQMDENSPYIEVPTYFIPYNLAICKMNCKEYYVS